MDDGDADRLPVFLSVSEIEFPVSELSARRVITIYNPYGHPIQYKVLCNAPVNYAVPNSKGVLMAKSCKDLVVKCTARLTVGTRDRLRVEIMRPGETEILGARDILLRTVSECDTAFIQPTSMNSNIFAGSDRGSSRGSLQIRNENQMNMHRHHFANGSSPTSMNMLLTMINFSAHGLCWSRLIGPYVKVQLDLLIKISRSYNVPSMRFS
ncbi:unnamed protein product [Haemonchus placei]|uniref:Motile sperm domain-containing protein 1 n=1 Tax=Haemonchus placei TaxID=6290 RepID=A0A0N4W7G5_HAEPC|nr:unnamed protein product [Haemonchus placei]